MLNLEEIQFSVEHFFLPSDEEFKQDTRALCNGNYLKLLSITRKITGFLIAEFSTGRYIAMDLPLSYNASPAAIASGLVVTLAIINAALASLAIDAQIVCSASHCYQDGNGILASYVGGSDKYLDNTYDRSPLILKSIEASLLATLLFATSMVAISAYQNILARTIAVNERKGTTTSAFEESDLEAAETRTHNNSGERINYSPASNFSPQQKSSCLSKLFCPINPLSSKRTMNEDQGPSALQSKVTTPRDN